jgi:phage gp36-like protein
MPLPTITPLTTQVRIESRFGQIAVDLRTDDDIGSIDEIINDATVEASGYLSRMYSDTQLQSSSWVELKVRDIAVFLLCCRRGNEAPHSVQVAYDKAIADLTRVQTGEMTIPDAATRKAAAPTLTNQRVRVYPAPHIVNVPHSSTGDPQGYPQNDDRTDYNPNP